MVRTNVATAAQARCACEEVGRVLRHVLLAMPHIGRTACVWCTNGTGEGIRTEKARHKGRQVSLVAGRRKRVWPTESRRKEGGEGPARMASMPVPRTHG